MNHVLVVGPRLAVTWLIWVVARKHEALARNRTVATGKSLKNISAREDAPEILTRQASVRLAIETC
jgi:hypothetical protein